MLDKLLCALNDVAWAYDHSINAYAFISPNIRQLLGVSAEEFAADITILQNQIIAEDKEHFNEVTNSIRKDECSELYYRVMINGKLKWIYDKRSRFTHDGKDITLSVLKDVSDQKIVDHHLRSALGDFSVLFNNNHHPMWIYETPSLRIIKVNNAAIEHYGYSEDEFLSMTIRDVRPKLDLAAFNEYIFRKGITKGKAVGDNNGGIWRHQNKNGEIIYAEIIGHEIRYNNTSCRIIIAADVTERILYEQRRKLENAE